jgi:hypothetical protein
VDAWCVELDRRIDLFLDLVGEGLRRSCSPQAEDAGKGSGAEHQALLSPEGLTLTLTLTLTLS